MGEKKRILVIEDDKTFCKTILSLLKEEGYDVESAGDGEQALEWAKTNVFDLIISDIRLPGNMDGVEAVKQIKSFKVNGKTCVIMMTGFADPDAQERAESIGVNDYMFKPFTLSDFLTSVKQRLQVLKSDG